MERRGLRYGVSDYPEPTGSWRTPGESTTQERTTNYRSFQPWRTAWQPAPVFLPGESPWTEEPGATVHGVEKSWTGLSN